MQEPCKKNVLMTFILTNLTIQFFLTSSGAVRPQFPAKFTEEASHQRLEEAKKQATGNHWGFPRFSGCIGP